MKRLIDLLVSSVGIVVLMPVLVAVAIAVVASSGRPVFFRHQRLGMSGIPFSVLKFRTMSSNSDSHAPNVTAGDDLRITPVGSVLRNLKLDELPQLWNVLLGEMSIVGPRPESSIYAAAFPEQFDQILKVRPGLTDPASIHFRHEERILEGESDPERFYLDSVLPKKLEMSLEYLDRRTITSDFGVMARTARSIVSSRRAE